MALGQPHEHFAQTDSTNLRAKDAAERGAPHGSLFTADEQTAGRGRQGRTWHAPAGSALLMSVVLRPLVARYETAPLAAALAVAETCEELGAATATIKWPNDIWIDARKVAGILIEARPHHDSERSWMVVGIGLNTSVELTQLPHELRARTASLGLPPDTDALTPLLERLEYHLHAERAQTLEAWRERDALIGREIRWEGGAGTAAGIDDSGNLLARSGDGELVVLRAGEVHLQLGAA